MRRTTQVVVSLAVLAGFLGGMMAPKGVPLIYFATVTAGVTGNELRWSAVLRWARGTFRWALPASDRRMRAAV
jgi:hypothetical protein